MLWLSEAVRARVEETVSAHIGRPWRLTGGRDVSEFAYHPAAILTDGRYAVFVKRSDAPDGLRQFEIEVAALRLLAERAGVRTPAPIAAIALGGESVLILEAVEQIPRSPREWRAIGRALARIHAVQGEEFGLHMSGYFGPLAQDNRPAEDWPTFYAERRIRPYLRLAVDAGRLPAELARDVERLIARLPELCGPAVAPALLHGDAQQNNFISTAAGAVVIDPAPYYGHPEIDLAAVDYFEPVPEDLFDGYRDERPIDPGFPARRHLWRVASWLAVVAVDGATYLPRLVEAVRAYR
jgi:fructosamine-3-kinase